MDEAICRTCGADWATGAFTANCRACGGGAMTLPCPVCGGACGARWRRAVLDTSDTGIAHWLGACAKHQVEAPAPGTAPARTLATFLFRFGYFTPTQVRNMRRHPEWDDEDSAAVFILAEDEPAAMALGFEFADAFVARLYELEAIPDPDGAYTWSLATFAHWIETDPAEIADARAWSVPTIAGTTDIPSAIAQFAVD
ncbi:MAG: hypothetical protein GC150_08670 [Rhizobiales bacterium]|nr:hypothetical protein [Hyphomicrobiales bacterium]